MEEPVKPTRVDRSEMRQIAAAIVESVRVNVKMPLPGLKTVVIPYDAGVFFDAIEVEGFVLKLAQEICATSTSRDTAIAHAEAPPPRKKTDINSETITTWRAACDAATPGEWNATLGRDNYWHIGPANSILRIALVDSIQPCEALAVRANDAAFIALARSALPAAIDECEQLKAALIASEMRVMALTDVIETADATADRLRKLLEQACEYIEASTDPDEKHPESQRLRRLAGGEE